MNDIFAIFAKKDKFCPTFLEGILHTKFFEEEPFRGRSSDSGDWRVSRNTKTKLPKELWFVTKDRKYNFDYRWDSGGYILSVEFLNLLQDFGVHNYLHTKIHLVNKHKENIALKEYYYVKFYNQLKDVIIDMEKSKIEYDEEGEYIKKISDLQLKNTVTLSDVFFIDS